MVKHVFKDGSVHQDIKGHLITRKDHPRVYEILERVNREEKKYGNNLSGNQTSK